MQEEEADNQDRHDASRRRVLWLLLFIDISKISDEGLTVATKRFRGKRFWHSQDLETREQFLAQPSHVFFRVRQLKTDHFRESEQVNANVTIANHLSIDSHLGKLSSGERLEEADFGCNV
jgi:hypothetical protein